MAARVSRRGGAASAVAVIVMAVSVSAGWWVSGSAAPRNDAITRAVSLAPDSTRALNVTDWAGIRAALDVDGSDAEALQDLTSAATTRDLAARSVLVVSAEPLADLIGWSPATVDWEAFSLESSGGALALGVSEDADEVADRLEGAGYTAGDAAGGARRWSVDESVPRQAGIDGPELFTQAAFLPRQRVLVFASSAAQVERVAAVAGGSGRSLADVPGAAGVASRVRTSLTALVQTGELACVAADPAAGGDAVRARADARLASSDPLAAYDWSARGLTEDDAAQRFTIAWQFSGSGAAAQQARIRGGLSDAVITESDRASDRLTLESSSVDGPVASVELLRDPRGVAVMPATTPLLLAACS